MGGMGRGGTGRRGGAAACGAGGPRASGGMRSGVCACVCVAAAAGLPPWGGCCPCLLAAAAARAAPRTAFRWPPYDERVAWELRAIEPWRRCSCSHPCRCVHMDKDTTHIHACSTCCPSSPLRCVRAPPCFVDLPLPDAQAIYVHRENEKQLANRLQGEFDSRYGGPWHCIVGRYVGNGAAGEWPQDGLGGEEGGGEVGACRRAAEGGGWRVQRRPGV